GANCFQLEIYTTKNNDTPDLESVKVFSNSSQLNKIICFTSPEAVSAFKEITVNAKLEISNSAFVACLGPLTAQRAKILFPGNLIEHASNYSYNGLIQLCNKLLQ
ncbi:MAG: uroporphyrinogen-III synthase, partial [Candidatus Caenarcaniphilales bacterium]|nr:uroporphyrinogen-III synthase [Candidatus Caenarcaniphilales bacterium]